jgi:UDP:flavonoid glycosyltransferase YjiC (YdhE family)
MPDQSLTVLVSPLDWGLGHASRCVPLVRALLEAGHRVILAGSGRSLLLLRDEFPDLPYYAIRGFSPDYTDSNRMILHLMKQFPAFIRSMISENRDLSTLLSGESVDVVIADNRYGLRNRKTHNILITHQVMVIPPKWMRPFAFLIRFTLKCLISAFDTCWIPDEPEVPGLSGDLAHRYPLPARARFIGPLSRFSTAEEKSAQKDPLAVAAILSGPEPQRSMLESLIIRQLKGSPYRVTLVSGKPEDEGKTEDDGNIRKYAYLPAELLKAVIQSAALVICRSGYSSVMDLAALGAKALFVPTPGQTEQHYLAELHGTAGTSFYRQQQELNLSEDIPIAIGYRGFQPRPAGSSLSSAIGSLQKKSP